MFEKTRISVLIAAAMLVTACGGGGGDNSDNQAGSTGGSTTAAGAPVANAGSTATNTGVPTGNASTPAGNGSAPTGDSSTPSTNGSAPSGNGSTSGTPATNPGTSVPSTPASGGTSTSADQRLVGYLSTVADQLVYIPTNRSIYNAFTLSQFESSTGLYDVASGSKTVNTSAAVPAPVAAPAAPIAAFGVRVDKIIQRSTEGQTIGNQTVVGRIAFDLTERAGSAGILPNEVAENMKFVIDGVELSTDVNGELVSARVRDGAQMHVYGRNAAGVEVKADVAVPANAVRLLQMSEVLDGWDYMSVTLLVDLEAAFSQAGQALTALENIAGQFSMQLTMSPAQLVRPAVPATANSPAQEKKELVGQPITVNTQPTVSGSGVSGTAWIRMYPPQQ
jgi:hypothetical protein